MAFDLPIPITSLALAGVVPAALRDVRAGFDFAASLGVRTVQLDATHPETRPRSLDRSARRDLAAAIRRAGLGFSGIDLWIPPDHFTAPEHADRAAAALLSAAELARALADLTGGDAIVATILPNDAPSRLRAELAGNSESLGVRTADHAWPPADPPPGSAPEAWAIGIDPVMAFAAPLMTPARAVSVHAARVATVRLTDADGRGPVEVGRGRLDLTALWGALVTLPRPIPLVIDARRLPDPLAAAKAAADALADLLP